MMTIKKSSWCLATCVLSCLAGPAWADVRLPKIFSDHMVLQQELPIRIWGWADPGREVTVEFNGKTAGTKAGKNGCWRVELPAMKADSKPHTLVVKGPPSTGSGQGNTIECKDVLLGEIWLCAGQSNMNREVQVKKPLPNVRLFWIHASTTPVKDDLGDNALGWAVAIPEKIAAISKMRTERFGRGWKQGFAEVGYVFGLKIHEKLKVPVGLVKSAYGGSIAKTWTPRDDIGSEHPFGRKVAKGGQYAPGVLYQSMMHGLAPLSVRGVVWYQGETDGRNWNYDKDLTKMIEGWRVRFQRPKMPFYLAQIAQTTYASGMERVWESQAWVGDNVPHTALAPSNDLWDGAGENRDKIRTDKGNNRTPGTGWPIAGGGNPHPPNKHLVALRLADIALVKTYGKDLGREVLAPAYRSHEIKGGKVIVKFKNAGGGLKTDDDKTPNWFEVSDGTLDGRKLKYVKATAKIVGKDSVEVWSPQVKEPKCVRFAWHALARHNLYSTNDLPAINFRTDTQPTKQR